MDAKTAVVNNTYLYI